MYVGARAQEQSGARARAGSPWRWDRSHWSPHCSPRAVGGRSAGDRGRRAQRRDRYRNRRGADASRGPCGPAPCRPAGRSATLHTLADSGGYGYARTGPTSTVRICMQYMHLYRRETAWHRGRREPSHRSSDGDGRGYRSRAQAAAGRAGAGPCKAQATVRTDANGLPCALPLLLAACCFLFSVGRLLAFSPAAVVCSRRAALPAANHQPAATRWRPQSAFASQGCGASGCLPLCRECTST